MAKKAGGAGRLGVGWVQMRCLNSRQSRVSRVRNALKAVEMAFEMGACTMHAS